MSDPQDKTGASDSPTEDSAGTLRPLGPQKTAPPTPADEPPPPAAEEPEQPPAGGMSIRRLGDPAPPAPPPAKESAEAPTGSLMAPANSNILDSDDDDDPSLDESNLDAKPAPPVAAEPPPPEPPPEPPPVLDAPKTSTAKGPPMLPLPDPKPKISVSSMARNKVKSSLDSLDVAPPEPKALPKKEPVLEQTTESFKVPPMLKPADKPMPRPGAGKAKKLLVLGTIVVVLPVLALVGLQMMYKSTVAGLRDQRPRYIAVPTGQDHSALVVFEPALQAQVVADLSSGFALPGFLVGGGKTPYDLQYQLEDGSVGQWQMGGLTESTDGQVWLRAGLFAAKVELASFEQVREQIAAESPMSVMFTGEIGSNTNGASQKAPDMDMHSALMAADERAFRSLVITDSDRLQALLGKQDAMHIAIHTDNYALAQWLQDNGEPMDQPAAFLGDNLTPLELAIQDGRVKWVEWLKLHGFDFAAARHTQDTLLAQAVSSGKLKIVTTLLENGHSPKTPDSQGLTEIELALMQNKPAIARAMGWDGTITDRFLDDKAKKYVQYVLETALSEAEKRELAGPGHQTPNTAPGWRLVLDSVDLEASVMAKRYRELGDEIDALAPPAPPAPEVQTADPTEAAPEAEQTTAPDVPPMSDDATTH